jgi:hypothetical protein
VTTLNSGSLERQMITLVVDTKDKGDLDLSKKLIEWLETTKSEGDVISVRYVCGLIIFL